MIFKLVKGACKFCGYVEFIEGKCGSVGFCVVRNWGLGELDGGE